ncbi:RNA polymerase sigma factor [Paludisphaera rhizosphaerae]|uniref:RNA polymerase sigma factor n=1 Tax=Paludisphaera rhizosphaerae TaxID=2711216 RepID=UPI0013EB660B|nr:sigma-70 family RNA polymerase sigma factor [Paludisphaera rhizosphaerae]
MKSGDAKAKLTELMTQTTLLYKARNGTPEEMNQANQLLMLRYSGAVHRYLLKVVGDPEVARDLNQEFSLKFLDGKFRQFDRSRGRFRDYLKRAVHNLMMDHFRKKKGVAHLDTDMEAAIVGDVGLKDFDEQFLLSWRQDLMARAWQALKDHEQNTGQPYWQVMRLRLARPQLRSPDLAKELSERIGRPVTAGSLRQILHRARDKFTEFLISEVRVTLGDPSRDQVEEELGDLKLLEFCKPSLARIKFDDGDDR